jgi:hypothetical protein
MLPKFRSFVRPIIRSFVRSFIVPIHHSSFVHSPYSSFFQIIFVLPLCCRNSDRSFVQSFDRSFIVPIHRSSFIHRHYSSFVHANYSPSFIVRSCGLFTIVTIHRHYSSSVLFIDDIYGNFFVVSIHRYYSSIIRSPQISTTHPSCCPVHLRPARPIFQSYEHRWLWFSFQWELPIWSPIPGFSKLSTLNFEIPSNQASKLRFQ